MEKLNEYLQILLSTCSYELHLEPNKTPYLTAENGTTEVANSPILGTQISMLVFPLIPFEVRQELPNKAEVEFVHSNNLGNFNFLIKKSPAGFNVTIRPLLDDLTQESVSLFEKMVETSFDKSSELAILPTINDSAPTMVATFSNTIEQEEGVPVTKPQNFSFEEILTPTEVEDLVATEIEIESDYQTDDFSISQSAIQILPVNSPEFLTVFSDTSTYDPPMRPQEYASEHESPTEPQSFQPNNYFIEQTPVTSIPQPSTPVSVNYHPQTRRRMDALFHKMSEVGASDLHLSVSMPPMIRRDGKMQKLECDEQMFTPETMKELLNSIIPPKNQEEFENRHDTDFAYEIEGLARFRANIFMDRKGMGGVFRIIPTKILTAQQLGLAPAIMNLCELSKGLVVVTGPTGSGKSTTLCAMVDWINRNREDHIITIEDPIEFTHENQKCLVNQREVHNHTDSFKNALRAALREDPDILLVGEMRDLETISIAIETAETGHLVFGTLHTTTAPSTVDRIIDQFPADRQQQIRVMLSESLKGVIAQTLVSKKGGGRVAALEVLIVTPAISNLIREGKTFQIQSAMQTGKANGMVMLNDALFDLVIKGLVEPKDAYIKAVDKTNFEALLSRNGIKI